MKPSMKKKAIKDIRPPAMLSANPPVTTLSEKEKALAEFEERKAHPPEHIDNSSLYAGSPMYYYCKMCGHLADELPESHISRPRQLCGYCQHIQDMGWFD